jgi:hypothetical protein
MAGTDSSLALLRLTVLAPLLAPVLLLDVTLRLSPDDREGLDLDLGATITSPPGSSFANGDVDGGGGSRDVMMIFAVDVGDRCKVRGCLVCADPSWETKLGFGKARI